MRILKTRRVNRIASIHTMRGVPSVTSSYCGGESQERNKSDVQAPHRTDGRLMEILKRQPSKTRLGDGHRRRDTDGR